MHRKQLSNHQKIKIFIAEDHPIFREGLSKIINNEEDLIVCGEADNSFDALNAIKKLKPDLVIIDITLKDSSGIELIKDIKTQFPNITILTLSMHDETIYAERALRAGAKSYIMKQEAPETVIQAIHQSLQGKIFVSDNVATRIFDKFLDSQARVENSPLDLLTDRELEVFQLIGQGYGTGEIAKKLYISKKTVENYREHIKFKLKLKTSIELVQEATLWIHKGMP
jgi:DNA-binding NarL/FixJ family response regulator